MLWDFLLFLLPPEVAGQGGFLCSQSCLSMSPQRPLQVVKPPSHLHNSARTDIGQLLRC